MTTNGSYKIQKTATCIGLQNLFPGDRRHSSVGKSCADYSNCFTSHLEIVMMIVMGTISYDSVVIVIMTSIIVMRIGSMAPPYCSTDTTGPCSP